MPNSYRPHESQRAAMHLLTEVHEESPLWSTGGGYKTPDADPADPYTNAVVGWPFASWVFSRWLDAGLLELRVLSNVDYDVDGVRPSWFARVSVDSPGHLVLSVDDSRELLQDVTRWSSQGVDGSVELVRTDATDGLDASVWIDVLRSFVGAPPIGQDPLSEADLEYRIATTDMAPFQRWFVFRPDENARPETI